MVVSHVWGCLVNGSMLAEEGRCQPIGNGRGFGGAATAAATAYGHAASRGTDGESLTDHTKETIDALSPSPFAVCLSIGMFILFGTIEASM